MIDIGANLTDDSFAILNIGGCESKGVCDVDFAILRAVKRNVAGLILTGGDLDSSRSAIALARKHNSPDSKEKHARILRTSIPSEVAEEIVDRRKHFFLRATVGVHPCHAQQFESNENVFQQLSDLIESNRDIVVAVGECGLDYDRENFCSREIQHKHFPCHFTLAARFKLPLFFHNRNTSGEFMKVLKEHKKVPMQGVVHSYTGSLPEMHEILSAGLYIGVNGCSLKTEENCQVVADIPMDRLLLETDAPYCEIRASHTGYSYFQNARTDGSAMKYFGASITAMSSLKKPKYLDAMQSFVHAISTGQPPIVVENNNSLNITLKGRNEPSRISEVALAVYEIKRNSGGLNGMSFSDFVNLVQRNTKKLFFI